MLAEILPAAVVLTDLASAGNPIFYINRSFTTTTGYKVRSQSQSYKVARYKRSFTTGYTRQEAYGRNCRFLQGAKTEPQSVAVMQAGCTSYNLQATVSKLQATRLRVASYTLQAFSYTLQGTLQATRYKLLATSCRTRCGAAWTVTSS